LATQITLASGALLTVQADGNFRYDPSGQFDFLRAGQAATDSFTYTMADSAGATSTATVTVTIQGLNDPPSAEPDTAGIDEDGVLSVDSPGVLANDSDVEADPLSAVLETGPSHGLLTLRADGSYTYTPAADFQGDDTFTYRASDGQTTSGPATVTITV
jgi:VCBS repeat-containing protein